MAPGGMCVDVADSEGRLPTDQRPCPTHTDRRAVIEV